MGEIKPPQTDILCGLGVYKSRAEGVGGVLKAEPSDFVVEEVGEDGRLWSVEGDVEGDMLPGRFTHFTLVKRDWETHKVLSAISKKLGVSRNRFSFAGTKDKRALTAQRVCAENIPVERLRGVRLADVTLKDFTYADENLGLGSLWGNRFKVAVKDVSDGAVDAVDECSGELEGGFPNFFGTQRFGSTRPITHLVGKHIILGELEEAVWCYLTKTFGFEHPESEEARKRLEAERDLKDALEYLPSAMNYEKALLNSLIQDPGDYAGALDCLPRQLKTMFVHAYQSYLFNHALSKVVGEGLFAETLPLVGTHVAADELTSEVMEAEGISQEDFKSLRSLGIRSKGERRKTYEVAYGLESGVADGTATFEFKLKKGTYATVLLREYMKN